MGLVVQGTLDLWIAERRYRLNDGDGFGFPSTLPHKFANTGDKACKVLWINSPPLYPNGRGGHT